MEIWMEIGPLRARISMHILSYLVMAKNAKRKRAQIADLNSPQIPGEASVKVFSKSELFQIGGGPKTKCENKKGGPKWRAPHGVL